MWGRGHKTGERLLGPNGQAQSYNDMKLNRQTCMFLEMVSPDELIKRNEALPVHILISAL